MSIQWPRASKVGAISSGSVHVWAWTFQENLADWEETDASLLSAEERIRMERFRFPEDQKRFRICHANLRRILAGYLGIPADLLTFTTTVDGRPALEGGLRFDFNLSHSKTMGMLAVSSNLNVGIDIEDIRQMEWDVAEKHFSSAELTMLKSLGRHWLEGFFRCWTSKEALLKAEGIGLKIPLDSFDVMVTPNEVPGLLACRPDTLFRTPWKLFDVTPARGYQATLAVCEVPTAIERFHFDRAVASIK